MGDLGALLWPWQTAAWRRRFTAVALALSAAVGCNTTDEPDLSDPRDQTILVMNGLAQLYGDYMQLHNRRPPPNEEAFRKFAAGQLDTLTLYHIDDPEKLWKSPRDGEPLKIIYGKKLPVADSPGAVWVAYEQTGVGGERLAVRSYGGADLFDEKSFPAELR